MITTHPAYPELREISQRTGKNVHILLEEKLEELRKEAAEKKAAKLGKKAGDIEFGLTELTKDLHFYPDLHGKAGLKTLKSSIHQYVYDREPVTTG